MRKSINELELDLKTFKAHNQFDRFGEIMTQFLADSKEKFQVLEQMFNKMDRVFKEIAQYFVFDPNKYNLDDLFGDIKLFKEQFIEAHKEAVKLRETEEKMRRAREAREKAEIEKKERQSKKSKLVDVNVDKEGVMDSLMEALQSGSAFAQTKRKRQRAANAGMFYCLFSYVILLAKFELTKLHLIVLFFLY